MCRLAASAYAPIGMRRPYGISHSSIGFGPGMPRKPPPSPLLAVAARRRGVHADDDVAQSGRDRRRRVLDVQLVARAADHRAVEVARAGSPRYSARPVGIAAGRDAVDVGDRQPGVVERGVDHRDLERPAVLVELAGRRRDVGDADDRRLSPAAFVLSTRCPSLTDADES